VGIASQKKKLMQASDYGFFFAGVIIGIFCAIALYGFDIQE
jgi:hypothetical protein